MGFPGLKRSHVRLYILKVDYTGLSKNYHHIIKIAVEFLVLDFNCVNNGKFHSLVQLPRNIHPIFTQLTGISNGDVADCKDSWLLGKSTPCF